jgi:hypothetical protein
MAVEGREKSGLPGAFRTDDEDVPASIRLAIASKWGVARVRSFLEEAIRERSKERETGKSPRSQNGEHYDAYYQ